jgi:VWFA-related protein
MSMNWKRLTLAVGVVSIAASFAPAQDAAGQGTASMVVTVEAKHGKQIPQIEAADIEVTQGKQKNQITEFRSLKGSDLQLMLLIDNSSQSTFDIQINDIKKWINSLPGNTQVAVGYMQNGMASMTQEFTSDHAAAANSIRVTVGIGGADVSPYDSLSDAVRKWPPSNGARREVLMISSGIEALGGGLAPDNPYVNKGIADAQRAGVVVYTIFNPSAGHAGHSMWRVTYGQNFLSQLSDETGGEAYITTFDAPVSFVPYLQDLSTKLQNQYLLSFTTKASNKTELQPVRVRVKEKNADIAAPDKVLVKASL